MTVETLELQRPDNTTPFTTAAPSQAAVSAAELAAATNKLDDIVDKLALHTPADLNALRYAAFVLVSEDGELTNPQVAEIVRNLYAPASSTNTSVKGLRALDSLKGRPA